MQGHPRRRVARGNQAGKSECLFFDQMQFLEPHIRVRESISTVDSDKEEVDNPEGDAVVDLGDGDLEKLVTDPNRTAEEKLAEILNDADNEDVTEQHTPPVRKSPRKNTEVHPEAQTPCTSKKPKLTSPSKSIAKVPLLSPEKKRGVHAARSKAKKEEMATQQIMKVVETIESQLSQPQATDTMSPDLLLGQEIGKTLELIKDLRTKFRFKGKLRAILGEMEEEIAFSEPDVPADK